MIKYIAIMLLLLWQNLLPANDLYDKWEEVLAETVVVGEINGISLHLVNYQKVKGSGTFMEILQDLKEFDISTLQTDDEKIAFWLNAYNIGAVKMILDHYPLSSIRKAGTIFKPVWKKEILQIGKKEYSLGEIEHEILRAFPEPRIHFAIVCASVSCPDLDTKAFREDTLDEHLERLTVAFIKHEEKGVEINAQKRSMKISQIFKWFADDFGGRDGVKTFIGKRLNMDLSDYKIHYLKYDWDVNEAK